MVKYLVAPARLPDELTWFKWEAYTTWLSGMGLLVLVYYLQAELFMIDAAVLDLTPWRAAAVSLAGLAPGWLASAPPRTSTPGARGAPPADGGASISRRRG